MSARLFPAAKRLVTAAFGISKEGKRLQPKFCLESNRVVKVGEDACFVAPPSSTGYQVFGGFTVVTKQLGTFHVPTVTRLIHNPVGIADGDPGSACFSKVLMKCCSRVAMERKVDLSCTKEILSQGFKDLKSFHSHSYGGFNYSRLVIK